MAIEKYVTKGIILESYDQGEHDRVFKVFTREFGLLMCHAKSIRKLESKLRAHTLPRGESLLTLVKGRDVWRLVGAERTVTEGMHMHDITLALIRFIRGEGRHKALYDKIIAFSRYKAGHDEQTTKLVLYYMLLVDLGYADATVCGASTVKEYTQFSCEDLYTHVLLTRRAVRTHIHQALTEIQL